MIIFVYIYMFKCRGNRSDSFGSFRVNSDTFVQTRKRAQQTAQKRMRANSVLQAESDVSSCVIFGVLFVLFSFLRTRTKLQTTYFHHIYIIHRMYLIISYLILVYFSFNNHIIFLLQYSFITIRTTSQLQISSLFYIYKVIN